METLARYYPELQDRSYDTVMVLCHARYSTNTVSTFERAQPFALLGHNGEINTINRFRQEARQVGVQLPRDGSDSQDVDRALEHFCIINNFNLMEAMEMVFPPSPFEIDQLTSPLSDIYTRMTLAYGAFAQGPAAIAARLRRHSRLQPGYVGVAAIVVQRNRKGIHFQLGTWRHSIGRYG